MEYTDYYNPHDENVSLDSRDKMNFLEESKSIDKGYTKIYRNITTERGNIKSIKVELYTTAGIGSNIRDAETGEYYKYKVGSLHEELFFKVCMATGQCKSLNGSNTLYYSSPRQCIAHLHQEIPEKVIEKWEEKYKERKRMVDSIKKPSVLLEVR